MPSNREPIIVPINTITKSRSDHATLRGVCLIAAVVLGGITAPITMAQVNQTPVYMDDSPAATEGIARARDQAARGNDDEAAEVLRSLLRTDGDRVIAIEDDPGLYYPVRSVIHRILLRNESLFERYLALETIEAQQLLDAGHVEEAEHVALLTPAGFEAALLLAQRNLESARFNSAWRLLASLETHPLRQSPDHAQAAALLATQVAMYLPQNPRVTAMVSRWRHEAGLDSDVVIERIEGPDLVIGLTPFDQGPSVELEGIVSRPLWSEPLATPSDNAETTGIGNTRGRMAKEAWEVFPTVGGDTIYINNGSEIAAWDRFTLTTRWRTSLHEDADAKQDQNAAPVTRRRNRRTESGSPKTVTTIDRWVVASVQEASANTRQGPSSVLALDAESGAIRWRISLEEIAPTLAGATITGRVMIDQGVVLVTISKNIAERRLDSVQLLGLELVTGRPLWRRQLGSTGTLPFPTGGFTAEISAVSDGTFFLVDSLGFAAAVETVSGRVRWVRDLQIDRNLLGAREAWASTGPVVAGDSVVLVTPDNLRIVELDARSGRELSSRNALELLGEDQSPLYPLITEDTLAIVGQSVVYGIGLEALGDKATMARTILDIGSDLFQGRAVIAGSEVIVPTRTGLHSAPIHPGAGPAETTIHLNEPGNVLAMASQLVVVDESAVRTYLLWDVAERVLSERMEETPTDPTPAVTFAELAYRASRPDQVLPAVRQALGSIEKAPSLERNRASRTRLFLSLLAMIEPEPDDPQVGLLEREQVEMLLVELGRAASSPTERVQQLMARGSFYEAEGQIDTAVESYQRVLDDPVLASSTVEDSGINASAQRVATDGLRRVIRRFGQPAYAAYQAEALQQLEAVMPGSGPEAYTVIAHRYPVSRAGAQAWLHAATAYLTRGRPHGAVFALESGLRTAEDALAVDDEVVGELAGRLIGMLRQTGRVAAAASMLDRLTSERPLLVLTDAGSPLDVGVLRASLSQELALLDRRPSVGLLGDAPPIQTLDGWTIMTPIKRRPVGIPTDVIPLEREGEIGLWQIDEASGLTKRWAVEADELTSLVDYDDDAVYLMHKIGDDHTFAAYDMESGEQNWASSLFGDLFEIPAGESNRTVPTMLDGARSATEQRVSMDDATMIIIDRGGRVVAYDKQSGKERWRQAQTIDSVVDVAVNAGVVAVLGARNGTKPGDSMIPMMLLLDGRTGQALHRIDIETGQGHWVRLTDAAEAIVGATGAVSLYDVFTGRRRWSVGGDSGRHTNEAWVFPGRIVVLNDHGELRQIETESGSPMDDQLDTRQRVTSSAPIVGGTVGDHAAFATTIGIVLYDRQGQLVGVDHRPSSSAVHPAEFGSERFVTLSMVVGARDGEVFYYDLHIFSIESCALEQKRAIGLYPTPTGIALLDGRILLTSGPGTVVLDTE